MARIMWVWLGHKPCVSLTCYIGGVRGRNEMSAVWSWKCECLNEASDSLYLKENFGQGFICLTWNCLWISMWLWSFILLSVSNLRKMIVWVSEEVVNVVVCTASSAIYRLISYSGMHLPLSPDSEQHISMCVSRLTDFCRLCSAQLCQGSW